MSTTKTSNIGRKQGATRLLFVVKCDIIHTLLSITDVSIALINICEEEDKQEKTGHNET